MVGLIIQKMHLLGFEPRTSRVWSERDNQLHHRCNYLHSSPAQQIWLYIHMLHQLNSKNIKNVYGLYSPSVSHSAPSSPCSTSSAPPSRIDSRIISVLSPFPSATASTSTQWAPSMTHTMFLSGIAWWDCCPLSHWMCMNPACWTAIVSWVALWLPSVVDECCLNLPLAVVFHYTEMKPDTNCCDSCCCFLSAIPAWRCFSPEHWF